MDQAGTLTAKDVVNNYSEEQLHRIFGIYGEIKNAKTLAHTLVTVRLNKPVETVEDLKQAISKLIPKGKENKYLAQVFQALRIEVNQELEALKEFLEQWENNPAREQSGFMYEKTFVDMMREFQQEVLQASIGDIPKSKNKKKK